MNNSIMGIAFMATLCVGCAQRPTDHFTLTGTVDGMDEQYLYLSYMQDTVQVIDSVMIEAGKFHFEGKLKAPAVRAVINPKLASNVYDPTKMYTFYLEPAEMTLTLDAADMSRGRLEGSFTQAQVDSLEMQADAIMDEAQSILDAMKTENDHEKAYALREQLEPYQERVGKLNQAFVATHPTSYAAPSYLRIYMGSMAYEEIRKLYDAFPPAVREMPEACEIADELAVLERVQPGQPAPDFEATDVNGKSFRLSDLHGNYVILDFWASWCVPCRKSNPHMKELYKKYHTKGLEFVYVADNDNQPDEWRKAIKEDGLERFHHVLRGMKVISRNPYKMDHTNDISDKYAIHFLPTKYLIDRDGKIVGKLDSDQLEAKLQEVFE